MPKILKTLSTETIHQNPWWSYKHDTYTLPDGSVGNYYYGQQHNSALIIPLLSDGRLVLVRQYRYLADKITVEFPMGAIDEGESPPVAAARELLEETGLAAGELIQVAAFEPLNGRFRDSFYVYVAIDCVEKAPQHFGPEEDIELVYRRPDEFAEMVKRGEITDGPTLASWALANTRVLEGAE